MPDITLDCPGCLRRLAIQSRWAGKRVRCPHCKETFTVSPSADGQATVSFQSQTPNRPDRSKDQSLAPSHSTSRESSTFSFLDPPENPDELGRLGDYRITKVLGEGGMGLVFLAEELRLERPVALKVIRPEIMDQRTKERFLREAQAAAIIDHERVITIYQVGEVNDVPFVAMRLLKGQSLKDLLGQSAPLPIPEIIRIGQEIAEGLAAAHDKGLIHRDIKPSNIWLEKPKGNVKLLDFGLVKRGDSASELSESGIILGTPAYMAPEQATNRNVGARADLFSLGCVLYQCCTSRRPFHGEDLLAVLSAIANTPHTPISSLNPGVPNSLADLIDRLLAKRPEQRPANAHEVREVLGEIGNERQSGASEMKTLPQAIPVNAAANLTAETTTDTVPVSEPSQVNRVKPPSKRIVRPWMIVSVCLLLAVSLGLGLLMMGGDPEKSVPNGPSAQATTPPNTKGNTPEEKEGKTDNKDTNKGKLPVVKSPVVPKINEVSPPFYNAAIYKPFRGKGQSSRSVVLAYSPDGKWFATTGSSGIKIWNMQSKEEQCTCKRESFTRVAFATFSHDGTQLVTGSEQKISVWDAKTGKPLLAPGGIRGDVSRVAFSPDATRIAACFTRSASDSEELHTVKIWDVRTNKLVLSLEHQEEVACFAYRPDGKRLVTASGKTITIWDTQSGAELRTIGHSTPVKSVAFSPNGERIVSGSKGIVLVTNGETGNEECRFDFTSSVSRTMDALAFSRDGKRLLAGDNNSIIMWDLETGKTLLMLHQTMGDLLAFRPDGISFVTTGSVNAVWTPVNKQVLSLDKPRPYDYAGSVAAHPSNGSCFASGGQEGIYIWEMADGKIQLNDTLKDTNVATLAFSPDGQHIASAPFLSPRDIKVNVWNTTKRIVELELKGHTKMIMCVAYSRDGRRIVTGSVDRTIRVWDAANGKEIAKIEGHTLEINRVAISPDGSRVISYAGDAIKGWDMATAKEIFKLPIFSKGDVAFMPGGQRFVTANVAEVRLSEAKTGMEIWSSRGCANCVALDPQGKRIATAAYKTIQIYDVETGELQLNLTHTDKVAEIASMAFTADGRYLVSSSTDANVLIWDLSAAAR